MSEPVVHGPPGFLEGRLPERTLFNAIAVWCSNYLRQPDGPNAGSAWRFTREQARILSWWYAYDEDGRWLHRRGTIRMCKGWGKDPFGAVIAAIEMAGPCRVDGNLNPTTHPSPWIQIAAVSRDQTRTTMRLFPSMFSEEARERFGLDVNKEIIYGRDGRAVIEAVTSSPDSLEGGRATLVLRNEVQNWRRSNAGHDMAEVIDGNLAKSRDGAARALSLCNAHVPGEDTVGEREWEAWQQIVQGKTRRSDVFYVAAEAPPDTELADEGSLRKGLEAARFGASWLDVDRLIGEVYDPRTTPSEARRKHLNQIVAAEDAWVAPQQWGKLADPTLQLADGDMVTLGFDGSKSDDHTALIATRVEDGAWFTIDVWDPAQYDGEAPRDLIDGTVRQTMERYDVVGFYSDLHPWESYVDQWADDFGRDLCVKASTKHPIAWDMRAHNKKFTLEGAERVHDEIVEEQFAHDGDARTREHVHNARRRPNRWGVTFGKEHRESSRKIDALPAGVLSRMARRDYLALPESKQRRQRSGKAAFV